MVEKTRNKVKTSEDSFSQLLSLFLSSKVLWGFSVIAFDWQLPTFSHFSFLIPLLWAFPSSNRHWKMVAVTEPDPSKGWAVVTWVVPPDSWKLLKQGTATQCSGVFPCYGAKMNATLEIMNIKGETFAIKTNKLTKWQETVLHKDKQISPIQYGMHIKTVTSSVLWCLKQSSSVERI